MAKRLASRYQPGKRSKDWIKVKASRVQDCVIVGFTPPQGGRQRFGSLAVAVLDAGRLAYAGQVGSGFDEKTLKAIVMELSKRLPGNANKITNLDAAPGDATWVEPVLVCEVKYNEWTRDGLLRQATFLGLRPDKGIEDCQREATPA